MPAGQKKIGWLDSILSEKSNDEKKLSDRFYYIYFGHRFASNEQNATGPKVESWVDSF